MCQKRVLIQNVQSREFLKSEREWAAGEENARQFESSDSASSFIQEHHLSQVQIVWKWTIDARLAAAGPA